MSHLNITAPYRWHSLSRPRGESDEKFALTWTSHHPDMDSTPGPGLIMKDWSGAFWLHPDRDCYFVYCIDFSVVWESHIAVPATREHDGSRGKTIWSSIWPHLAKSGSWVLIWRYVSSLENTAERVGSYWFWGSLNQEHRVMVYKYHLIRQSPS